MKIAVVGSGISGLAAAYFMRKDHDVHVFESNSYPGGHSHTVRVNDGTRELDIDTGFIVFNQTTYPGFTQLLTDLRVETIPSEMSFSVSCHRHDLEFSDRGLRGMLAQPKAILRPGRLQMAREISRFYREAIRFLDFEPNEQITLQFFLDERRYGREFRQHFIVPMVSSIWSTPPGNAMDYPAVPLLQFLRNHGLLRWSKQIQWRTILGGSTQYINEIVKRLPNGVYLNSTVKSVNRFNGRVHVTLSNGTNTSFDRIVVACHSDQALQILADATPQESTALSGLRYEESHVVLHKNPIVMPHRRRAWASWNYVATACNTVRNEVSITYYMNRLQSIESTTNYFVSLNPQVELDPDSVIAQYRYAHPIYTISSSTAQSAIETINGDNLTHFAGAYLGHGFHEDALRSGFNAALDIAKRHSSTPAEVVV